MTGTYTPGERKELSGVYTFIQAAAEALAVGQRGVVAIAFTGHWGPDRQFIEVTNEREFIERFGRYGGRTTAHAIRETLFKGKPRKVYAYRITSDDARPGTLQLQGATAGAVLGLSTKYKTSQPLLVNIKPLINSGQTGVTFEIFTNDLYPNGVQNVLLERHEAYSNDQLVDSLSRSQYVVVEGSAPGSELPAPVNGATFSGGSDGSTDVGAQQYIDFLDLLASRTDVNTLAIPGLLDNSIHDTIYEWLSLQREYGNYLTYVRGGDESDDFNDVGSRSEAINQRYVINVGNGVLYNGNRYTSSELTGYIAARVASVPLNGTLTDEPTPFDDVGNRNGITPYYRTSAKRSGTLIFVPSFDGIVIDEAVNTLTKPREFEAKEFGKIRVSTTLDTLSTDTERFGEQYKRTMSNTDEGRAIYAATVEERYLAPLVAQEVLRAGASYQPDPEWHGPTAINTPRIDEAYFVAAIQPIDSTEIIYQKIGVSFNQGGN